MQQRLMSGYDKPIAGQGKFCRAKSCSSAGPAASSLPREDKNLLREMKMVPLGSDVAEIGHQDRR